MVTPENKLFAWRLLAAIGSIDFYVTLKNKDQYQWYQCIEIIHKYGITLYSMCNTQNIKHGGHFEFKKSFVHIKTTSMLICTNEPNQIFFINAFRQPF